MTLSRTVVETAKGYMAHERGTLDEVTQARNIAAAANRAAAASPGDPAAMQSLSAAEGTLARPESIVGSGRIVSRPQGESEHDCAHGRDDLHGK